jgi:hypothetical protein
MAATRGFYLRCWIQVINIMIYKKPGVIKLDKLRIIHLFEADFNLLVRVYFGRRAMHHQVDRNLIHPGQFGKPGGKCQDAALSKVLHNLMAFFTQTPMGQFESDATACFGLLRPGSHEFCFYMLSFPRRPHRTPSDVGASIVSCSPSGQDSTWRDYLPPRMNSQRSPQYMVPGKDPPVVRHPALQ